MRVTMTKMEVSRYTQRQECNVRNENNNWYNVVKTKKGKGPGYDDRYRDEDWTDDEEDGVD